MSHDNRFSKTNYLKTNLLKQIKKIFSLYTDLTVLIQLQSNFERQSPRSEKNYLYSLAKLQKKSIHSK